jgi:hypothetical protein
MSYIPPPECSYPQLCKPNGEYGDSYKLLHTVGPYNKKHTQTTDYSVVVCGVSIPIVKTDRQFSMTFSTIYGIPPSLKAYRQEWGTSWIECEERPDDIWSSNVVEDCTIIKSTLHYIDERYGVCLYSKITQKIQFDVHGRTHPCTFKESYGTGFYHKVVMVKNDFNGSLKEEWILVVGGVETVITIDTRPWIPYFVCGGGKIWTDGWVPDPNVCQVLVLPQPPSTGIATDNEVSYYGFYDYLNDGDPDGSALNRADGGCQDFFYPDWCRQMQEDPFWKAAAARRFDITWCHSDPQTNESYTPPPVVVNPLPLGTYAKHPIVGELYQFLATPNNGTQTVITSPDLNALIDKSLPYNNKTHDTTLYFPIGVI